MCRHRTMASLMVRYHIDQQHANRVADMARSLAQQLSPRWALSAFDGLSLLQGAALLHELGLLIEYKNHHHHGGYIISHSDLPGFYPGAAATADGIGAQITELISIAS